MQFGNERLTLALTSSGVDALAPLTKGEDLDIEEDALISQVHKEAKASPIIRASETPFNI
jgi:hypothetical protein